jgi:protein TonB
MKRQAASAAVALVCALTVPVAQAGTTPPATRAQTVQDQATDSKPVVVTPPPPTVVQPLPPQALPAQPGVAPSLAIGQTHDCASFYPPESLRAGEAGSVAVGYDVAADGGIANVHIVKTSGFDRLDQAVLACVQQAWRNTPAMQGGVAVASPGHTSIVTFSVR